MADERTTSTRELLARLALIRNRYGRDLEAEKLAILARLRDKEIGAAHVLERLHDVCCFLRAFPDNRHVHHAAGELRASFHQRIERLPAKQRETLDDSGIAGTTIHHEFSYELAERLVADRDANVDINWDDFEEAEKLDEVLVHFISPAEESTFEEGDITTQAWVRQAKGGLTMTDLSWVLRQFGESPATRSLRANLYDAAEVPLKWHLDPTRPSRTASPPPIGKVAYRSGGMRRPSVRPIADVAKPLAGIRRLSRPGARRAIDVAIAALAVRHREVHAFGYANEEEVYLAPLGRGAELVVMGVKPAHRLGLEGNYGYLLTSNGVPVGYGGVSPLFHQANTGINIFDEFRGSEAAFLFTQTLRCFHTLFGSTRFIASPYQFGEGNSEAIGSGALWFYYKLGFRPTDASTRAAADREFVKITRNRKHRSEPKLLRQLARCDFELRLTGHTSDHDFDEGWLGTCASRVTDLIADVAGQSRRRAVARVVADVAKQLDTGDRRQWPKHERLAFERLAPVAGLIAGLDGWSSAQKRALVSLMQAKGKPQERGYVTAMRRHDRFRLALADCCSKSEEA